VPGLRRHPQPDRGRPQAARPLHGIVELLAPLADRFAAVALISGRPAAYLAAHASAPSVRYLGLYGLQVRNGQIWVDPRLEAARPAVMAAHEDLRPILPSRPAAPPGE
jgi:trehalose 6-phosphate phosphatase